MKISGRARRLGDDINTDYIIASTRKRETLDTSVLREYLLETVDPSFAASVRDGDILVAGRNFGCGSAMEIAVTVILAAGIGAVLAESFSRTFFRNAINNGLLPVTCDTSRVSEGDALEVVLDEHGVTVPNCSVPTVMAAASLGELPLRILSAGGLVSYIKQQTRNEKQNTKAI